MKPYQVHSMCPVVGNSQTLLLVDGELRVQMPALCHGTLLATHLMAQPCHWPSSGRDSQWLCQDAT